MVFAKNCGSGDPGNPGFQSGNKCAGEGSGSAGVLSQAKEAWPSWMSLDEIREQHSWDDDMPDEHVMAAAYWVQIDHKAIRWAQKYSDEEKPDGMSEDAWKKIQNGRKILRAWNSLLDSSPKHTGVVYRGIETDVVMWKEGDVVEFNADASASRKYVVAERFSAYGEANDINEDLHGMKPNLMLEVSVSNAPDISRVNEKEAEVILRKGSRYRVTSVDGMHVKLVQVDSPDASPSVSKSYRSVFLRASGCGAGAEGDPGFESGNTCAAGGGSGGGSAPGSVPGVSEARGILGAISDLVDRWGRKKVKVEGAQQVSEGESTGEESSESRESDESFQETTRVAVQLTPRDKEVYSAVKSDVQSVLQKMIASTHGVGNEWDLQETLAGLDHPDKESIVRLATAAHDRYLDGWASKEAEAYTSVQTASPEHVQSVVGIIGKSSTMSDETFESFRGAIERSVSKMPAAHAEALISGMSSVTVISNPSEVEKYIRDLTGMEHYRAEFAGVFLHGTREVFLDGVDRLQANRANNFASATDELAVHEFAHAIDQNLGVTSTKEWSRAWRDEIKPRGRNVHDPSKSGHALTSYAAATDVEGWAEYVRLVHVDPKKAIRDFPQCWAVYKKTLGSESSGSQVVAKSLRLSLAKAAGVLSDLSQQSPPKWKYRDLFGDPNPVKGSRYPIDNFLFNPVDHMNADLSLQDKGGLLYDDAPVIDQNLTVSGDGRLSDTVAGAGGLMNRLSGAYSKAFLKSSSDDDCDWKTIRGNPVCIDDDGNVDKGPAGLMGQNLSGGKDSDDRFSDDVVRQAAEHLLAFEGGDQSAYDKMTALVPDDAPEDFRHRIAAAAAEMTIEKKYGSKDEVVDRMVGLLLKEWTHSPDSKDAVALNNERYNINRDVWAAFGKSGVMDTVREKAIAEIKANPDEYSDSFIENALRDNRHQTSAKSLLDDPKSQDFIRLLRDRVVARASGAGVDPDLAVVSLRSREMLDSQIYKDMQEMEYDDWSKKYTDEEQRAMFDESRANRQEWNENMKRALSMGTVSPMYAELHGYHDVGSYKYDKMPEKLWHVTTAVSSVLSDGRLKTRDELKQVDGAGLGGGTSDTISFTADYEVAVAIKDAIREAGRVARGEISVSDMIEAGDNGDDLRGGKLDRPMTSEMKGLFMDRELDAMKREVIVNNHVFGREKPEGEGWVPSEGATVFENDGKQNSTSWERPMTEQEKAESRMAYYKRFAAMREEVGGPMDPLFFSSDVQALARMPMSEVQIIEVAPVDGAQGYQVSALGEWRTHTGDALKDMTVVADDRTGFESSEDAVIAKSLCISYAFRKNQSGVQRRTMLAMIRSGLI